MNIKNVNKIYQEYHYHITKAIVLEETGKVFIYCFYQNKIIREIIVGLKFKDIYFDLCETDQGVYQFDYCNNDLKKTNFINFYDYYSSEENKTYKTIHIKTEETYGQKVKYLTTKEIQLNPEYNRQTNENVLVLIDKNVFDRKFQNSFSVIKMIGSGSFGEVFKVKERTTEDSMAIKRIKIQSK
jgi:hypothetical protein